MRNSQEIKKEMTPLNIQEIQKVSYEILKLISDFCKKYQIKYCLAYGTLIGAVRHNGFIPWDDDIDIIMPRPDYDRFLHLFSNENKKEYYKLINHEINKNYIYNITRVYDSRYPIIKDDEKNVPMGIFIDIYPYDGLGNNANKAIMLLKKTRKYCDIIVEITRNKKFKIPKELNYKGKIIYLTKYSFHKILGVNFYLNKLNSLRKQFSYSESEYVGPLMWFFTSPDKVLFYKWQIESYQQARFEDSLVQIPKDYDNMLKQEYGDYMTLPPEEKRIYQHNYKAYKRI